MIKYLIFSLFFLIMFSSCDKDETLFDLYSIPVISKEYNIKRIDNVMVNDILVSLININNFKSRFDKDGISYIISDKLIPYNMYYFYHIENNMYYGCSDVIDCDYFICINRKSSLYTKDGVYICEIMNHLVFNVDGRYYKIPYIIRIKTDLKNVIDISLIIFN